MIGYEAAAQPAANDGHLTAPARALDADFDRRWALWVARGRVHEQRLRRRLIVGAGVLASASAIAYAFLRS
jgi:hypothetical protein